MPGRTVLTQRPMSNPSTPYPITWRARVSPSATVFASSAAIMVIQLVAGRLIAAYVGQSLFTWTGTIGVTLAGIAVGNYVGGRIADWSCRRRVLGTIFLLCGIAMLTVLLTNRLCGNWPWLQGQPWPLRILLHVTLVFLPPFTLLGAISPVIVKRALQLGAAAGRTVGAIYAWSIAGSITGTFVTGYFLLSWLPNALLLALGSAGLAAIGLLYWWVGRDPATDHAAVRQDSKPAASTPPERGLLVLVIVAIVANACIMAVELVAARLLARSFGSSLYTWTSIIGVILAGMSLGGYAGGWLADRLPNRGLLAGLLTLASAVCLAVPLLNAVLRAFPLLWGLPWAWHILANCALIYFLPAFLLGAVPPVLVRMGLALRRGEGRTVGLIYAWGSVGSIAGTLATGFILIDSLGTVNVLCIVSLITAALGLCYAPRSLATWGWGLACLTLILSAWLPLPRLNRAAENLAIRPVQGPGVFYVDESDYTYIKVYAADPSQPNVRSFALDKLVHSIADITDPTDLRYPYEWFYAAVLDRLDPPGTPLNAMVIGGGGYAFPRYFEVVRPGNYMEVIEIDPAVTEAAHAAFGLPRDTSLAVFDMDARNRVDDLVRAKEAGVPMGKLDYVFGDSINDYSVPFHLTTVEFTRKLASLMEEDGIYMLNLIDMYSSGRFLGAMVSTCEAVFPYVYVFSTSHHTDRRDTFVVVSSRRPINLRGIAPAVNAAHGCNSRLLTEEQLDELKARTGGRPLTDDFAPVDNMLAKVVRVSQEVFTGRRIKRADALLTRGRIDAAEREALKVLRRDPARTEAYMLLARVAQARGDDAGALEKFREAVGVAPQSDVAHYELARALYRAGDREGALMQWNQALMINPKHGNAHADLGALLYETGMFRRAIEHLEQAAALQPDSAAIRANLAAARFRQGDLDGSEQALVSAVALAPADAGLWEQLAQARWRRKDFDGAWEAIDAAREAGGTPDPAFLEILERDAPREGAR